QRFALPGKMQQLAADRTNRSAWRSTEINLSRPASSCHDDSARGQRTATRVDDQVAIAPREAPAFQSFADLRAGTEHRRDERSLELPGFHISMRRNQQAAGDGAAELRFLAACFSCVKQRKLDTARREPPRHLAQMLETFVRRCDVDGSRSLV